MENKDMHPKILENNMCERPIKCSKTIQRNHAK
jgi:hypothetical protein